MQLDRSIRVVEAGRKQLVPDLDLDVELLAHLPLQAPAVVFTILHLAAGELPVSGQMRAREPLGDQYLVRPLDNRGNHHHPSWRFRVDCH